MRFVWDWPLERMAEAAGEEPHGPGALTEAERRRLARRRDSLDDAPAAGARRLSRLAGRAAGARVRRGARPRRARRWPRARRWTCGSTRLKTDAAHALKALAPFGAEPAGLLPTGALRIAAPAAAERAAPVEAAPEFAKGWFEVQDLGSQIAAAAAGEIKGKQVLDFCAGGGGKTLALAAAMGNTGQLYAYDADARRLADTVRRAPAGRGAQPAGPLADRPDALDGLEGRMDLVFVDAPCTGSGTWRRHPDAKWRLTPEQLERRMAEQDAVLAAAAAFVKPGGRLVYVTCSLLPRRTRTASRPSWPRTPPELRCGAAPSTGAEARRTDRHPDGFLRLTPRNAGTDGFFVAVLQRPDDGRPDSRLQARP